MQGFTEEEKARIRNALEGARSPWRIEFLDLVGSTQDEAQILLETGSPPPFAVLASEQTEGRGRRGRAWNQDGAKDLSLSLVLRPGDSVPALLLPILLAGALHRGLEAFLPGGGCRIKWPNDILLGGRKLAGILIEGAGEGSWIAGIGVNVGRRTFPADLANRATSLALVLPRPPGRAEVAARFLRETASLLERAEGGDPGPALEAFHRGFALLGKEVVICSRGDESRGRLLALDPSGAALASGRVFALGEIESLRGAEP